MKATISRSLLLAAALMALGSQAYSQLVSLDAVYSGTAGWRYISFPRADFAFLGGSVLASSGLTSGGITSEGSVDFSGGYDQNDGLGRINLFSANGDEIIARISGQGTIHHYAGTFMVTPTGGKGRFAGATGSGTFLIEAGTYGPGPYGSVAPATLTVHGSVTAPAIPEPSTLALLASSAVGMLGLRRRKA